MGASRLRATLFRRTPGSGAAGRPLEQGDLLWLALDLIAAQPRHGYEVIKAIEEALNGHYAPSPGAIYPMLTLLEETGFIAGEAQGAKKLYRITEAGRAEVEDNAAAIAAAKARLNEALARFGGVPAPKLLRALGTCMPPSEYALRGANCRRRRDRPSRRPSTAPPPRSSEADRSRGRGPCARSPGPVAQADRGSDRQAVDGKAERDDEEEPARRRLEHVDAYQPPTAMITSRPRLPISGHSMRPAPCEAKNSASPSPNKP